MSIGIWKQKLLQFFEKIFQDDYELNPYHAERIFKYLEVTPVSGLENKLLESSFFSEILLKTYNGSLTKTISVKIFISKVLSTLYRNELQFSKLAVLIEMQTMTLFMCTPNACAENSDLLLACINVITAPIVHYSGVNWLVEMKMWRYVLCSCTHTRPVEVTRASYYFITQLVWKLNEFQDDIVLAEIFEFIIKPIKNNQYQKTNVIKDCVEKHLYAPMMSHLNALLTILSETEAYIMKRNHIVPLLIQHFNLELQLQVILDVTRDPDLASVLCELLFKLYFAAVKESYYKYKKTDNEIMNEITSIYNNVVHKLIAKQMPEAVADYVVKCNLFLAKLGAAKPLFFERDGKTFEFQNQFIMHLLVPMWTYYVLNCGSEVKLDAIHNYSFKLLNITAEHITQSAENFKNVVEKNSCEVIKITIYTVRNLFQFRGQLNKATAGILYQGLFYVIQTFVMSDDGGHLILGQNPLKTPDDIRLLSLALDAIKMLLKEHHITWYENLEIICLQMTLLNLLKQKCLCTKALVQTIDLIDISVQKFLSPDMTLLMETRSESSLPEIGEVTREYIQHEDWEVRDSALNLLLSCTDVCFVKYIPLQKLISDNNLMLLAAKCALNDPEVYVQSTALQCLSVATKIDKIWRNVMKIHPNLHVQLVNMARRHDEGIIRKEAVNVLTGIYVHQNVTSDYANEMYRVMASVALNDLHFEVQIAALNFWRFAIKKKLLDRGMIDGKFPTVTFSKEKRKIVVFSESEIIKQLNNIVNDLCCVGCLTVLDRCLNEENNVAVMEEAYKVVTELKVVLDHYKFSITNIAKPTFDSCINGPPVKMDLVNELTTDLYMPHEEMFGLRDVIINEIINTPQNDLILEILKSPVQHREVTEIEDGVKEMIQPKEFLEKFNSIDYASIIEGKKNWNSGDTDLGDLIDEILNTQNAVYQNTIDMCDV